MLYSEKAELKAIVKSIPEKEIAVPMAELWRKYAPEYCYASFVKYFKVFKKYPAQSRGKKDGLI